MAPGVCLVRNQYRTGPDWQSPFRHEEATSFHQVTGSGWSSAHHCYRFCSMRGPITLRDTQF